MELIKIRLNKQFSTRLTLILLISCAVLFSSCNNSANEVSKEGEKELYSGPLFTSMNAAQTGVAYVNILPEATPSLNYFAYPNIYNGGGVSLGDINNDGLTDIYFTSNFGNNKLYLNKGNFKFEDVTQRAGLKGAWGWSNGTSMVDINGDGLLDIYVCRSGNVPDDKRRNELYINYGNLTFSEQATEYGLDSESYSAQASFFDYDGDGDLDMYLANQPNTLLVGENFDTERRQRNDLTTDKLFRNDQGKFVDVSVQAGLVNNGIGFGHSASIGDLNNDGWPDIYVTNDYTEHDYLYYNNGDGTFSEKLKESMRHISMFSMGSDIGDFNNDGLLDIMVVDMVAEDNYRIKTNMSGMNPKAFKQTVDDGFHYQYMTNTLHMNNGNGTFSDVSKMTGLSSTDWSWAPLWADFDNDGLQDLFVTNGYRKDVRNNDYSKIKDSILREMAKQSTGHFEYIQKIMNIMPEVPIKNYVYKNDGDISFSNKSEAWGITEASFSNGAAYADLDNDGDLDMVISNIDQEAILYRNNAEKLSETNFVKVSLQGYGKNAFGIGARVTVKAGDNYQTREQFLNRGYISSVENKLHFGLGKNTKIDSLWVKWPNGDNQLLTNLASNELITIQYKENSKAPLAQLYKRKGKVSIEEVTQEVGVDFVHKENDFDDFSREILLPHKMSTMGPGMAVADVNGDGLEDFYIGGAKGFSGSMYLQTTEGMFQKANTNIWSKDAGSEDMAAVFFDVDNDNDQDLYVVSGGNEFDVNSPFLQDRLYVNDGSGNFVKKLDALPKMPTSGGVVSASDYDNDGDMDLFVGGRGIPGMYPKAPRSYILQNHKGIFTDVTKAIAPAALRPGLVTSALWSDYDNDGRADLILAGEWMPITVLRNTKTTFENTSEALGLTDTEGWWYSIAAGDFDGDGDEDYLVGNLGQNYKYQATLEKPFDLFYDDFDNNNQGDIVLSYTEDGKSVPLRGRECSSQQMPFIKEKFKTYDAFAKAELKDIFTEEKLNKALHLQSKTFQSMYLQNNGLEPWKLTALPRLAQVSSVNGIVVQDLNGDQKLDAILAGNLYGSEVETPRNDAGNGLVILGNGDGSFRSLGVSETGFFAPYDVKAMHQIKGLKANYIAVVNNSERLQIFRVKK